LAPQEFKSPSRRFNQYADYRRKDLIMCIAVPAEVIEIKDGNIGVVDYGDLQQEVRLDLVDVQVGEFVLVHVGFAIQKLSREEGLETRELFKQVYAAMED
jgi:hydrogenase expression/formation protein HypC